MTAENSGKQRAIGTPFQKGKSGNPGGRPKGYVAFRAAFRDEKDEKKRRARLMEIIENGDDSDALKAIQLSWEYGWGKAPNAPADNKAIASSGSGLPSGLTFEQLRELALAGKK